MASLTVVSGQSEGQYHPLGKRTLVIGRSEAVAFQVEDDLVSRKHIQIRHEARDGVDRYTLLDMNSNNGTMVNGRRVDEVVLENNDMIEIGRTKIMYSDQDFEGRESAMEHYKKQGERGKSTLIR